MDIFPPFAGRLEEAKTFSVELRPYHDPMLPKSRDDVDMRILYKGTIFFCLGGMKFSLEEHTVPNLIGRNIQKHLQFV